MERSKCIVLVVCYGLLFVSCLDDQLVGWNGAESSLSPAVLAQEKDILFAQAIAADQGIGAGVAVAGIQSRVLCSCQARL